MAKSCTKCGLEKPLSDFYKRTASKDGYNYVCKECQNKYLNEWRKDNETNNQRVKRNLIEYRKNNAEKVYLRDKKYREMNKEKRAIYSKEYIKRNKARLANHAMSRIALKLNATPSWLTAIHKAQIQEFYDLALARSIQTGVKYQVDHIHPLKGIGFNGLHVPWNLQILSASENLSKGNKLLEDK